MITIEDGIVKRDGEPIGKMDGDKVICSGPIHHKVKSAVESAVGKKLEFVDSKTGAEEAEVEDAPEALDAPLMDYRGDKTPAYVEWYRKTHSDEEFQRKYPRRQR